MEQPRTLLYHHHIPRAAVTITTILPVVLSPKKPTPSLKNDRSVTMATVAVIIVNPVVATTNGISSTNGEAFVIIQFAVYALRKKFVMQKKTVSSKQ